MVKKLRQIQWRRLSAVDIAWLHFKVALAVLLFIPLLASPTMQNSTTGVFLTAWVVVSVIGTLLSTIGLLLGAQRDGVRRAGIRLEMAGLCLLIVGPAAFMMILLGLMVDGGTNRWTGIMFCYVICAALVSRMVTVWYAAGQSRVIYRYVQEERKPLHE
jgi:nitrogen fixation/metabolism regulation signal transduction histidine kinase